MNAGRGLVALIALIFASSAWAQDDADVQTAREAVAAFSAALQTELAQAMQAGGPLNAIEVCKVEAPAVAGRVSLEQGVSISRVSLRNRNPANKPNRWQAPVLQSFEERRSAGEEIASLTWSAQAPAAGGPEFRYMQAIPTGAICLQCHGETIAPEVAAKLGELYPLDQATGFREGDIRGAFVVTRR